jgi:hypothetical protein
LRTVTVPAPKVPLLDSIRTTFLPKSVMATPARPFEDAARLG